MRGIKTFSLIVLFVFILSSAAFPAERAWRTIRVGGGYFGGIPAFKAEVNSLVLTDNLYFNLGVAVADSETLAPSKDSRRFTPLYVDMVFYFADNAYFGAGVNYPMAISDDEKPEMGYEAFLGVDFPISFSLKLFTELGYSELRREGKDPFVGSHVMIGLSVLLSRPGPEKAPAEEFPVVEVKVAERPTAEVTEEAVTDLEQAKAEINLLEAELKEVEDRLDSLNKKMIKARAVGDTVKFLELQRLEQESVARAKSLK